MELLSRRVRNTSRLGVLSSAFNPPTIAHMALASSALSDLDEVLFVLPRIFPHKDIEGATLKQRIEMVQAAIQHEARFSLALADRGLFIEIARECREALGPLDLSFLCGRDAAERIVNWDYGSPDAVGEMLREFSLLVAGREGEYRAPAQYRSAVRTLKAGAFDEVSSSEVRRRIAEGGDWKCLVPEALRDAIPRIYGEGKP